MTIYINDVAAPLGDKRLLLPVLENSGLSILSGIAVAVNNSIVPKSTWATYQLQPEDKVSVFTATQGG